MSHQDESACRKRFYSISNTELASCLLQFAVAYRFSNAVRLRKIIVNIKQEMDVSDTPIC